MQPIQIPITGSENPEDPSSLFCSFVQFYRAFNTRDIMLMSKNWAQTEDIAMDNPLGDIKKGWDEIKAVYERIFNGPARVYVEFYDYTIHETKEMFYAIGRERGEFRIGDNIVKLAIRTTRIFKLFDGQWLQVHHHGSIDDPTLLARYQTAVRNNA